MKLAARDTYASGSVHFAVSSITGLSVELSTQSTEINGDGRRIIPLAKNVAEIKRDVHLTAYT